MSFDSIKANLFLGCLENSKKIYVDIAFKEDAFRIAFLKSTIKLEEILKIFYPLYIYKTSKICINYSYIKKISIDDSKLLKLILYSPSSQSSIFTMVLSNIEFAKSLFSKSSSHLQNLQKLYISIISKRENQILKLRKQLVCSLCLLNQLVSSERKYNPTCEKILIVPFAAGRAYQDRCLKELANNKVKYNSQIDEEVLDKIKELKRNVKKEEIIEKRNVIKNEIIKERKSSSDLDVDNETDKDKVIDNKIIEDEKKDKSGNTNEINSKIMEQDLENSNKNPNNKNINFGNLGLSRIMSEVANDYSFYFQLKSTQSQKKNIFENYNSYRSVDDEIKVSASYFIEISTELLFTVLNIDKDYFNSDLVKNFSSFTPKINKQHDNSVNREKGGRTETDLNAKKPKSGKLSDKAWDNFDNIEIDIFPRISEKEPKLEDIMKKINFCKDSHSLFPCNSKENILVNTGEIINRKFFESFFDFYFKNVFAVSLDKSKILNIDEINDLFLALKRLKFNIFHK